MSEEDKREDKYVDLLTQKIRVELERKEIEQQQLEETRRLRIATQRQARNQEIVLERYAHLGEQVDGLTEVLRQYLNQVNVLPSIEEWLEDLHEQIETINHRIRTILEFQRISIGSRGNGQKAKLDALLREIDNQPEIASLRRQITVFNRRLRILKEKEAMTGGGTAPEIVIEIEDIESKIAAAEAELDALLEE